MITINEDSYQALYGNIDSEDEGAHLCSCACNCSCHCNCRRFREDEEMDW